MNTTVEYLQDRSNTPIINKKISNKKAGIWNLTLLLMTQKKNNLLRIHHRDKLLKNSCKGHSNLTSFLLNITNSNNVFE